jgi:hypothetical protein
LALVSSLEVEYFFLSDDDKPKEATAVVPSSATSIAPKTRPQEETIVEKSPQDLREKAVDVKPPKRQKKTSRTATVSLESHQPSSSSDHVSTIFLYVEFLASAPLFSYMVLLCSH